MDDTDLRDALDRAIGDGPSLPTPLQRLADGQRALRRRRAGVAALVAAVVVAVVVPVAAMTGRGTEAGVEPLAPPSSRAEDPATPEPSETSAPPQPWPADTYVRYTEAETLEIRPGVRVLDRVNGYLDGTRWVRSVALEIRFRGEVSWVDAAQLRDGRATSGWSEPSDGWADFRAWVADQAAANGAGAPGSGGSGYPDLVEPRGDGTFEAAPGVTILAQQADPDLPENFASASETTGAAYVERDGTRYLVLSRTGDLVVVPAAGHGSSLEALLDWARERYASGEGLL